MRENPHRIPFTCVAIFAKLGVMQDLDQTLATLVENIDGALVAAVGGMDGLIIEQYPQQEQDLSNITAEQTTILTAATNIYARELKGGNLREFIVTAENLIAYTRLLNSELFCLIIMNPSGNIGKVRLYTEQAQVRILEALT